MKSILTTLAAALFVAAMSSAAMAQSPVSRFDQGYLDEHPKVARQLAQNPHLVDNPEFIEAHPGLRSYFANHPEVREELREHPDRFMSAEGRLEQREDTRGPHPLANTDRYFDSHPEVAEQLNANPKLVDDPKFVASHPGLHDYLEDHPTARREWRSHPYRFIHREDRFDKTH